MWRMPAPAAEKRRDQGIAPYALTGPLSRVGRNALIPPLIRETHHPARSGDRALCGSGEMRGSPSQSRRRADVTAPPPKGEPRAKTAAGRQERAAPLRCFAAPLPMRGEASGERPTGMRQVRWKKGGSPAIIFLPHPSSASRKIGGRQLPPIGERTENAQIETKEQFVNLS